MATSPPAIELRAASLFDVDPELGELLDRERLADARGRAIVAVADLPPGTFSPAGLARLRSRPFAMLVLEGIVIRELIVGGSTATELLGACDVVDLRGLDDALLRPEVRWSVPDRARIAMLDDRVLAIVRTWPGVARLLLDRTARRGGRLAVHRAITQLPRVDQRLVAFFAHLAERWGKVAPNGIVVPLQLTHETLGRLIGARRPTVSLALKELSAAGLLERRGDGAWLLSHAALHALASPAVATPAWQPAEARPVAAPEAEGPAAAPRPKPAISDEEVAALVARVTSLRRQHLVSMERSASVCARARSIRSGGEPRQAARDPSG